MRKRVYDINVRDFTYVIANLRPEDEEELRALLPVTMPRDEYAQVLGKPIFEGMGYSVYLDDAPIAVFGVAMGGSFATATIFAFGTHKFKRAVPTISHFVWNKISHDLYNSGVMRLECRALSSNTFARDWLKRTGFHEDCELPYYGTKGESFHLYSMTLADYTARFKERLN
jgi:hypothetical protein